MISPGVKKRKSKMKDNEEMRMGVEVIIEDDDSLINRIDGYYNIDS